jgi:hypothetical protein
LFINICKEFWMKLEKELSRLVKNFNELVDVNLRTDFTEDSDFSWSSPFGAFSPCRQVPRAPPDGARQPIAEESTCERLCQHDAAVGLVIGLGSGVPSCHSSDLGSPKGSWPAMQLNFLLLVPTVLVATQGLRVSDDKAR